jgi:hypothetical protein
MHEQLKQAHELAIAGRFVAFLRGQGRELGDPRPGDIHQREPDAVSETPEGSVGVEVASAYYSKDEARDIWAPVRGRPEHSRRLVRPGESIRDRLRRVPMLKDFDATLEVELQRTMEENRGKDYRLPAYLVLDATSAALTIAEVGPRIVGRLRTPAGCPFLGIYLALTRNGTGETVFFPLPGQ